MNEKSFASLGSAGATLSSPHSPGSLRSHRTDLVAAALTSLLIVIGAGVLCLGLCWLMQPRNAAQPTFPIGYGMHQSVPSAAGSLQSIDLAPQSIDVAELQVASMESQLLTIRSNVQAIVSSETVPSQTGSSSQSGASGTQNSGAGEHGALPAPDAGASRSQRWHLKFVAQNRQDYARQLDQLGIELATVGGGITHVDYGADFSTQPAHRTGSPNDEKRLYFAWRAENQLKAYDAELMQSIDVPTQGRMILRMLPPELEDRLAVLELKYAMQRGVKSVAQIRKTIFTITSGTQTEVAVTLQDYN